jgi:hypothetical protein
MSEASITEPGQRGLRARIAAIAREYFYCDLRSLALLRMALGLLIIADQAMRARHLVAHYTDAGAAPSALILDEYGYSCYFSIHWWLSGSAPAVAGVFLLHALAAAALLAGFRTRLATIACWYLQASLLTRTPLVHTAGDRTLLLLLFWSMFLPLGLRWSLDARRRPREVSNVHVSMAAFAILMQVCFIYWFSVVLKLQVPMWREGYAVDFALTRDSYATAAAVWIRQFHGITQALTLATLAWELLGPALAFVPRLQTPGRILAVVGSCILHLSFAVFMNLGIFAFISCAAWLVFLPSGFWDRFGLARAPPAAPSLGVPAVVNAAAAGAFGLVVLLNLGWVPQMRAVAATAPYRLVTRLGYLMRLRQDWGMFTHEQTSSNGWYVVVGALAGGREIDLLAGGAAVSWAEPEVPSRRYRTARWAQYFHYPPDIGKSPYWAPYVRYLCRRWNEGHGPDEAVSRIAVWFMLRRDDALGGQTIVPVKLYEAGCAG